MLVVDSSILISSFLPDESGPDLEALFDGYDEILAPGLLWAELRNVLLVAERRGRVTDITSDAVMEAVDALGIVVDHALPGPRVTRLARRHGLSAHDSLYLELAIRRDAPLATRDSRLARAARAEGIRVEP
ncbi:MAG TPA: type II toxin-antitoxin system VapC family toxin [Arachnia sp.]|nr:type II toxin-antitoxin system VapC family toxin [Arachnia sp.]